jgi:hypothetical protein
VHGQGHNIVAVLGRDQISGLEEDAGTLGEGGISPGLAGCEGRIDGRLDIGLGGIGVSCQRSVGGGVSLGESLRALDLDSMLGLLLFFNIQSQCLPPCQQRPEAHSKAPWTCMRPMRPQDPCDRENREYSVSKH